MKKILLFASMALSLVAFAAPTVAAAETIKDSGAELADVSVGFTGKVKFNTLGSGIECNAKTTVTVNGTTIKITGFEVLGTVGECVYTGEYEPCVLKSLPVSDDLNLINVDVTGGATDTATITAPTKTETHPVSTQELQTKAGSTSVCPITTNDLTVVHETGVSITADVLTTTSKISGLKLTGKVRVDRGAPGEGTTTPSSVNNLAVEIAGTQTIEAAKSGTYNIA